MHFPWGGIMTSLYGVKPEPMPLDQQQIMALITMGKQLASKQEPAPFHGPALSSKQLETWFPGLEPIGQANLSFIWDAEHEELLTVLEDSGRPGEWVELGVELMPAESLIDLGLGGGITPRTLIKRGNPHVGYSHRMDHYDLAQLLEAASDWFNQSQDAQVWCHEWLTLDHLCDLSMANLGSGYRMDLSRDGHVQIMEMGDEYADPYRYGYLEELCPHLAKHFRVEHSSS
jgi:hypothetical protein